MYKRTLIAAAAASIAVAGPAGAQVAGGLVTVQVANVDILRNSLNNNDVDVLNNLLNNNQVSVPLNLQVPIGIAATVCDVNANVLAQQLKGGGATCTAKNSSEALGGVIAKQVLKQRSGAN